MTMSPDERTGAALNLENAANRGNEGLRFRNLNE